MQTVFEIENISFNFSNLNASLKILLSKIFLIIFKAKSEFEFEYSLFSKVI